MLIDAIPFGDVAAHGTTAARLLQPFIVFLEKKLGVKVVYDGRDVPFRHIDCGELLAIANALTAAGILQSILPSEEMPDEPRFCRWTMHINVPGDENQTAGMSASSDNAALTAGLAEALERYLWCTQTDYFVKPRKATVADMHAQHTPFIAPEAFTSFSDMQREQHKRFELKPGAKYQWVEGESLVSRLKIYVPAQVVSSCVVPGAAGEPLIREQSTNGLATWPTRAGAQLRGALELIERDAFIIMWFNQLSMPRISYQAMRHLSSSLGELLARCERYRLTVHAVSMATDAPTHAICAVVEDASGHAPYVTVGLKAHRNLAEAIEKALLEALRARRVYRNLISRGTAYDPATPVERIGHRERLYYWGDKEKASQLKFLVQGREQEIEPCVWEDYTDEQHLARIIRWCKQRGYECVSVPLRHSAKNPTPWHIEMIVMPQLQPIHLLERGRHLMDIRLNSIPREFGYAPRQAPFTKAPHPFC